MTCRTSDSDTFLFKTGLDDRDEVECVGYISLDWLVEERDGCYCLERCLGGRPSVELK